MFDPSPSIPAILEYFKAHWELPFFTSLIGIFDIAVTTYDCVSDVFVKTWFKTKIRWVTYRAEYERIRSRLGRG